MLVGADKFLYIFLDLKLVSCKFGHLIFKTLSVVLFERDVVLNCCTSHKGQHYAIKGLGNMAYTECLFLQWIFTLCTVQVVTGLILLNTNKDFKRCKIFKI